MKSVLLRGRGRRAECRQVSTLNGHGGRQRLLLAVREKLLRKGIEQERALLGGLVLGQRQRVERLNVVGQTGVGGALRDLGVQGEHVGDGSRVGRDHRQRGLAGLGRAAQLPEMVDNGQHGGHPGLDVRREGAADGGGLPPDAGGRGVRRAVPVRQRRLRRRGGAGEGDDPGRLVPLVLQGLDQAGDLLSEVGELRHPAKLGRAAGRRRHPQATEDQAHDQRQHDNGDQAPRHRPVLQG